MKRNNKKHKRDSDTAQHYKPIGQDLARPASRLGEIRAKVVCCDKWPANHYTPQPPGSRLPTDTGRNPRQTGRPLLVAFYDMQEDTAGQFLPRTRTGMIVNNNNNNNIYFV